MVMSSHHEVCALQPRPNHTTVLAVQVHRAVLVGPDQHAPSSVLCCLFCCHWVSFNCRSGSMDRETACLCLWQVDTWTMEFFVSLLGLHMYGPSFICMGLHMYGLFSLNGALLVLLAHEHQATRLCIMLNHVTSVGNAIYLLLEALRLIHFDCLAPGT